MRGGRLDIGIIGMGHVGPVIGSALRAVGHTIVGVSASSEESRERADALLPGIPILSVEEIVSRCQMVVLTVPDDQLEGLVKGFCQCGRKTNSVTEGCQHKTQDRVVCSTRTLDIDRLDVEQATTNGQSQQVTPDNRGIRQVQNIELRGNRLIGVVGVLDLSRTGDRRRRRKRNQP